MVKADSVGLGGADDEVLDFVFGLQGRAIAIDYADRLWRALRESMSWLADEPGAGVHPLAGVSAGDFELYLTRRARLILRLPGWRAKAAAGLVGQRLDLGGEVGVSAMSERRLWPARVLYASFVSVGESDEGRFLERCQSDLAALGVGAAQLVCGKARRSVGREGEWRGFSLMIAGLDAPTSLRLQHRGIGGERGRGCGIFVPHKSVAAVGEA
ncbi:MAG: type I-MYXAN CRISPR-associated protein Cas6/Cmx6 [Rhodocyclaceae bacterium]|nr:type I-MYXAN CRISPR-associated protein Cas6/Cmx6 [Rhodocyclaceae bacterium]MBK6552617.1 type I-MYXAN CRISPR-associated protein Cas6/Cmx6 [Rhodocyclaceae bacterium]MBK9312156.1 type I-MYXAN CRISPR-associated protein Cas6/Cmx6 [Rhodocyclaceae bacterium]MBK9956183.1 type I-MYXAN CRISPR-associated protein Cas6/Cmx6 [Rhodocyclaceae bacterium]